MDMNQAFGEIVQSNQTLAVMLLILANFALGVLVALKDGKFAWSELSGIITKSEKIMPLVGYLLTSAVGQGVPGPTGTVVQNGALLAALPYVLSIWKSLKASGAPQAIVSTLTSPVGAMKDLLVKQDTYDNLAEDLAQIGRDFQAGKITADQGHERYLALREKYPKAFALLMPPGEQGA